MVHNKLLLLYCFVLATLSINVFFQPLMAAIVGDNDPLVVETKQGRVKGFIATSPHGKTVEIFYGIPYAEPPLGKLRFQQPVEKQPWADVLQATIKPNSCVQTANVAYDNFSGITMWNPNTKLSEDCLKLNVWVPRRTSKQDKLAVLVWIYGGAFSSGTSTLDLYDASTLVSEENVIAVSMNYRVASFGFLSFGDELVPGNAGLHDQRLALKWVKDNIGAFGGDENRITIFGESAGALSVGFHLLSPFSRNLFTRAIFQSGSPTASWASYDNASARKQAKALAVALKCSDALNNNTLQCLLNKEAKEIVKNEKHASGIVSYTFLPVYDGDFITNFTQVMSDGRNFRNDTTVLLGTNANEGSTFLEYFLGLPTTREPDEVTEEQFTTVIKALNPVIGEPSSGQDIGSVRRRHTLDNRREVECFG
ncbi:hypothetical protein HPB48_006530 [Haemaphysalis longicornis]|uniref:Carboxylic ester hydrolase n=1 Tax=Haemaphysalis longicornis TaxID=44386 RepID=A0A9J6G7C0_HAELO|nr:hypothetical protein HPB48_006530 [Haemaphysalis longicornis]